MATVKPPNIIKNATDGKEDPIASHPVHGVISFHEGLPCAITHLLGHR